MPSKEARVLAFENPFTAQRVARVAIHWPERRIVQEFLVDLGVAKMDSVQLARQVPDYKRPLSALELQALDDFAANLCLVMEDLLKEYYEAGYHLAVPKRSGGSLRHSRENYCTARRRLFASEAESADQPFCLIAVPSKVLRTQKDQEMKSVMMRLERITSCHFQNPTDIRFRVDISKNDYKLWSITDIWLQNRHFRSLAQLKKAINAKKIALRPYRFSPLRSPHASANKHSASVAEHQAKYDQEENLFKENFDLTFPGTVKSKFVRYENWTFYVGVQRDTGVRFFDIRFNAHLMVAEAGLEEIVTIYHGDDPLGDRTVSLASVQGIGEMWSELSPGVDCPAGATYLSVPMVGDPASGPFTIKRGLCLFESDAATHGGANRRFFGLFNPEASEGPGGYAAGVHEPSMFVVGIATLFGNQYRFVTIFTPAGGVDMHVTPTTYVHLNFPLRDGYTPAFLQPAPQTTNFLFYLDLDVISRRNIVEEVGVGSTGDRLADVSMHRRVVRSEVEEPLTEEGQGTAVKHTLVCSDVGHKHRCMQVSFSTQTPVLFSKTNTEAFSWITKKLWVSRYHEDEMRGSSVYNGVDISEPVVNFSRFIEDNESVLNEDVVIWANLASVHVPSNEDYPHTFMPTANQRITLKPVNFFEYSPDSHSQRHLFTESFASWLSGYVMDSTAQSNP
uniref:Amine oxidase n=1 Tax=Schistocephalus solidus TaxID=70667 RepID=A0A0X3P6W2_SCHSO